MIENDIFGTAAQRNYAILMGSTLLKGGKPSE